MRTPPSSSARYPARLIAPTPNTSTVPGTSSRTSTPSFAAAINALMYADTPTKYASVTHSVSRATEATS